MIDVIICQLLPDLFVAITKKLPNYISPKIKDAYAALDKFVQHNYER